MPETFFITTAIDYTNAPPHIGHAYEKILADVLARYHRLKGDEVFFLTGVDQHGQKVQQSAEKAGVAPQQFVDEVTKKFTALWEKLDVKYSAWAATTDSLHKECVRANLQKLWDDKDPATGGSRWIYKKTQRGFYSVRQEQFLTDKERGPDGQYGPEWGVVEERDEENFYFRLMQDPATGLPGCDPKQWLLEFIDKRTAEGKPFVVPEFRVAELRNAVAKLEGDLCISRPASRLKWGIPFPESFGAGFVTYVWFDALVNYISYVPGHDPNFGERTGKVPSSGFEPPASAPARSAIQVSGGDASNLELETRNPKPPLSFADWWPPLHVIGKDILIPAHGVYWPIMLKALGFADDEMPTLLVHGWWNIRGKGGESEKMSKSLGNVVDPDLLADKYGVEALRYYLMSDIATGRDADFSEERLVQRYNSDLANSLGNLLNRSLNMAWKYREGRINNRAVHVRNELYSKARTTIAAYGPNKLITKVGNPFDPPLPDVPETGTNVDGMLNAILEFTTICNTFIEQRAPWKLAKDPAQAEELDAVLYALAESLRIIGILIEPVLPQAAVRIFDQIDPEKKLSRDFRLDHTKWDGRIRDGHQLGKPVPLFPRIEASPAA